MQERADEERVGATCVLQHVACGARPGTFECGDQRRSGYAAQEQDLESRRDWRARSDSPSADGRCKAA